MDDIIWTKIAVKSYNRLKHTASFEKKLDETLATISLMPFSFPYDFDYKLNRAVIDKKHVLYYQVSHEKIIRLILFFETKSDPNDLKKLL